MEINNGLIESFKKWLKTLGYAPGTINISVRSVTDFFFYLKTNKVSNINQIQSITLNAYYNHLQTRKNKRQPGSLSENTITVNINSLKRFSLYLQKTGKPFFEVSIKTRPDKETIKAILTTEEIKNLYKACDDGYPINNGNREFAEVLSIRDRAILSIYYGCGLRRSEGVTLDLKDILLKEKLILVRSGKGNKERYVPMSKTVKDELEIYIINAREHIQNINNTKNEAFLLSLQGNRLCGNAVIERLHKLTDIAQIPKRIGLHSLRHSIATHLLQSGMTLEEVSRFLGHSSLESTQIYTHIANTEH